jgi:hypothetical protein
MPRDLLKITVYRFTELLREAAVLVDWLLMRRCPVRISNGFFDAADKSRAMAGLAGRALAVTSPPTPS